MHHALQVQEILLNIFGHCFEDEEGKEEEYTSDLASLARTCYAFREPALNLLWEDLNDISPLVRCLPEASHQLSPDEYSFNRSLTQTEWRILRGYTRRIRLVWNFERGIDEESARVLSNPPTTEPLFPNLRNLYCKYRTPPTHLLHSPFPSLTSLIVNFQNPHWLQDVLHSFSKYSPNIRDLCVHIDRGDVTSNRCVSECILRWKNIRFLVCPLVSLDADALVHLSRVPTLTSINCALWAALPTFDSPLSFSNLRSLKLRSESLDPIISLLSQSQFPAASYVATTHDSPSRQRLSAFLASVQSSNAGRPITFELRQSSSHSSDIVRSDALLLGLEDLQPLMTFGNLFAIEVDIEWSVGLRDSELLTLASAWPHLKELEINKHFGWNTLGGITPNGLVQLFRKCRLLYQIALAIDTRGYIELPSSELLTSLTPLRMLTLNVLDSTIEAESVPAVYAFFACTHYASCTLESWNGDHMVRPLGWEVYRERWDDMCVP